MTITEKQVTARAREERCPRCNSQPYVSCHGRSGVRVKFLKRFHTERRQVARAKLELEANA